MMPHRHSEDRVVVLPNDQTHFHWAKSGEYITQVTAIGPLGLEYLDPADDSRVPSKIGMGAELKQERGL